MSEPKHIELFGWIGEDEKGSGEIGLKQALTPAGMIPLCATTQAKMDQGYIVDALKAQASTYGKTIRLVRFVYAEEIIVLRPD